MTIREQITRLGHSVDEFATTIASLGAERFLEKFNGWSPRDVVAHLIGWNRHVIEGGSQIRRAQLPFYDRDPGENYSKVNAELIRRYSSKNAGELLDELRKSAAELTSYLRSLDRDEWARDFGVRHAGSTVTIETTVDELIADYDHHRRQIEDRIRVGAG
jgi:hypothetical protein